MKHTIFFDNESRDIDIRLMDKSFIVYRKLYRPPLTPENIGTINAGDWAEHLERFKQMGWHQVIEEFFRKQIHTIGGCGVLAWDGNGVIGKMYFTTKELFDEFQKSGYYCVEHESMPKIIQSLSDEELRRLLASPSKTLRIACFNIGHFDSRYQGKGIASAMINLLKTWAKERGWIRLETLAYPDVVPWRAWASQILRRGALERRGFHVVEEQQITENEAMQQRAYLNRYLKGELESIHYSWGFEEAQKRIQDSSDMSNYHKKYLMVCDL